MIKNFISYLIILILVLISVAFFTLLERKVLSYMQIRKGPNKVGLMGLLQPISDALKLFTKEILTLENWNLIPFLLSPLIGMMIALLLWILYPQLFHFMDMKWGLLFFLCCSSISVYPIIIAGWSSNSKYALLGAYRGVAQTISYEVSFSLILFSILLITSTFNLKNILLFQHYSLLFLPLFPLILMWLVSCLAETNRTPFDFTEGESELVSGFNVEYMSTSFALIFMAEYANILFISLLTSILFLGPYLLFFKTTLIAFFFLWVRSTFPRYRYDKLMNLAWKSFLPFTLNFLFFSFILKSMLHIY
uniref:NADH-ubiquinone oxidoreductase chain 1 n=1 Tax=Tityus serrulatus TaxID=6887 RepID=A0A0K1LW75_TITSE|nr:NADH dehydrogenase subunit 1 [Tityus serrulatus]AKU46801.1 NADH dehydrogenase subunit 1 [Tityus serrulatus]